MKKHIGLVCCFSVLFSGCLNLNLKQMLPDVKDYDLNTIGFTTPTCSQVHDIGLVGIQSADLYDTKQIVFKNAQGQVYYAKHTKFIDLPKNMLKNMLLLQAAKHCLFVSRPPHITTPYATIKLDILSLAILEQNGQYQAQLVLDYSLNTPSGSQYRRITQSQTITAKESDEILEIKALQHVSLKAITEILEQIKNLDETKH
ncbi:hypothetical protein [Helicobacter suis]|uniref:ABC_trans_aux domain-containing protein n=1 Tax=Helicobacter suis TaxID=104628 RepID=A0ABM7L1C7_9HELI|nr:hypothetical protein [Helicobacter suis]EFX43390.1 hypothetical protein HSUHS1_0277 [Helicobacter suis HS1]BCD46444.1 ABC_trans_aux domain-containing protein [Helicobacter suis]BCD47648.1 ABC_trans_aux domain-containing protein [Helicobacter suis]BCD49401.1 ABC_trans_aux domain-containing protein [Helicobacter suis]BCD51437.1 ABC_trans_aux domain-containing protein [Helicobacter suis]